MHRCCGCGRTGASEGASDGHVKMLGALAVAILLGNGIGSVGAEQNTGTEGHASLRSALVNTTEMSRLRKDILDPLDPYVPPSNLDEYGTRVSTQFRLFKAPNPNPRTLTPTLTLDPNPNPNPRTPTLTLTQEPQP